MIDSNAPKRTPRPADQIAAEVRHHRGLMFWFGRRQPRYQADFTAQWGEWFDDRAREDGEYSVDPADPEYDW